MIEVADVFRRFAADYLSAHGASMLPSHRRAIEDILNCRTAALGGQVWRCEQCDTEVFSWHSCRNRSCPKCHTAQTKEWLESRQAEMLPVPYFHVTVTVPAELREALRAHQRDGYAVLMQASAGAIIELARDPRYVGGTVAVLAVLSSALMRIDPYMLSKTDPPTKSAMLESTLDSCWPSFRLNCEAVFLLTWAALGRISGRWRAPTSELRGHMGLGCELRSRCGSCHMTSPYACCSFRPLTLG